MSNNIWIWFFFRIRGRIRRMEYLLGLIFLICVEVILMAVQDGGGILNLVTFWANCALVVKRAHDLGYGGIYVIAVWCALFLAAAIFITTGLQIALFAGVVIGLAFNLWLLVAPGQAFDNPYGPPPVASKAVQ